MKNYGEIYQNLWNQYLSSILVHKITCDTLKETEKEEDPTEDYSLAFVEWDYVTTLKSKANNIESRLIRKAQELFSPQGSTINIDRSDLIKVCNSDFGYRSNINQNLIDAFSPKKIWTYLEQTFNTQDAKDEAYQKLAKSVISKLNISTKTPPVKKKGGFELSHSVYLERWSTGKELSYSSTNEVINLLKDLKTIFSHSGLSTYGMNDYINRLWNERLGKHVASREKIHIGENIQLTTFHTSFKYLLDQEAFNALNIFVAKYGNLSKQVA